MIHRHSFRRPLATLLALMLLTTPFAVYAEKPLTLLVGVDGFRWDILDRYELPNLERLAREGVRVKHLQPVMPSKTFPNFYAIATGLYPENNGVLGNAGFDPVLEKTFRMSDQDDSRWFEGEPVWITVEKQNKIAATMFWVGTAAAYEGVRPSYWRPFDGSVENDERVAQVMTWVDLPVADRPDFISVYFEALDSASHGFGVGSDEEAAAASEIDDLVGSLWQGLQQRGLLSQSHIVVVGDHGMTNLSAEKIIYLDDYVDLRAEFSQLYSPQLSGDRQGNAVYAALYGEPDNLDSFYESIKDRHEHLSVFRKGEYPDWFHLSHPVREPGLVIMPDNGWLVSKRGVPYYGPRATHGFSPLETDMQATLLGYGPAFAEGKDVPMLHVVDIYSLLVRLMQLSPANNDGNASRVQALLRQ
ncbi:alkaline phosphatase family protein [Pseudohongiella nitratireducens]|uniref:Alkaline phosphatase family protein n=1 Tax=Pseudohongiella nitratireducens TaxID=1768907 RepID=A0A917GLT9_9GAMM|nr:ectonucleotide pyrophosphatase/phosphodiesterase [Pseudohongiella nitratireducens]MDF1622195.1 ectonucleotide pyrophosphatase/phosphodiesterase [Pseudohongiella nitratireducens]GGG50738.1 alkaline phosphatase family protein [Pseudohongiella nitratireducens]